MPFVTAENFNAVCLIGLFPEEIHERLVDFAPFKCKDIFKNIAKGIFDTSAFTTLNRAEREYLAQNFALTTAKPLETKTDSSGTQKISLELFDKNVIEAVLLFDREGRKTACISSQVGCPLGCAFCKTGTLGFSRNLYPAEIVEEFLRLEQIAGQIDNAVFMGMGEPLLNLENVTKAINILSHKEGRNLSKRRITISTAGVIAGIEKMATLLPEVRLAVSLTTADESLRKTLMPVAETNPLGELKAALKKFSLSSKRRITLELALMHGVNTNHQSVDKVITFARDLNAHINLIPWNKIPELNFETPSEKEVRQFEGWLKAAGLNVTRRAKHGGDIAGACGQLGKVRKI